jgi:CDP-diacylglycerol--inositol 3-phosphatidyltransferase
MYLSSLYYHSAPGATISLSLGRWSISIFTILVMLDISSHYMHIFWSFKSGASSHKNVSSANNPLLKIYYESRFVLFFLCAGDQLFWITLYALRSISPTPFSSFFMYCCMVFSTPICLTKQIINIIQLLHASSNLAKLDFLPKDK